MGPIRTLQDSLCLKVSDQQPEFHFAMFHTSLLVKGLGCEHLWGPLFCLLWCQVLSSRILFIQLCPQPAFVELSPCSMCSAGCWKIKEMQYIVWSEAEWTIAIQSDQHYNWCAKETVGVHRSIEPRLEKEMA